MKPHPIAVYIPSLRGGGAERVMLTLANGFAQRGHTVDLVLVQAEGPYLSEVSSSVRVVDLGAGRVMRSLPRLVRYLQNETPVALVSALNYANIVAVAAHRLAASHARLIVTEHSTLSVALKNTTKHRARWLPRLMRWMYPLADAVVAVSNGVRDDLAAEIGLPRERIHTVYNPVVSTRLLARSREPASHPWFGPNQPPVVLGVGRLTVEKDFATLIRAFARVRRERDARLMILGEGELRDDLETLVRSLGLERDVALPGFVDNPYAYMRQASVFVLSSRWEGLPTVLIEAMACGTPVVATDCPSGPSEILEEGRWGRLTPVGDVEALAEAIMETLDAPEHPDVARRAQDFSAERAVDEYLRLLGLGG